MLSELTPTPGTPFGLYVHVPFCATRCGYCDFNTYTATELRGVGPDGWLAALRTELRLAAAACGAIPVDTVFVGGGTPSLLGADRLEATLAHRGGDQRWIRLVAVGRTAQTLGPALRAAWGAAAAIG